MKKLAILAASAMMIFGMTVPVAASEPVTNPVGTEVEARLNYSPNCPKCGKVGTYVSEQPDGFGHIMVFRQCTKCNLLYHYYV